MEVEVGLELGEEPVAEVGVVVGVLVVGVVVVMTVGEEVLLPGTGVEKEPTLLEAEQFVDASG